MLKFMVHLMFNGLVALKVVESPLWIIIVSEVATLCLPTLHKENMIISACYQYINFCQGTFFTAGDWPEKKQGKNLGGKCFPSERTSTFIDISVIINTKNQFRTNNISLSPLCEPHYGQIFQLSDRLSHLLNKRINHHFLTGLVIKNQMEP